MACVSFAARQAYWASRPTLKLDEAAGGKHTAGPPAGGAHPIKARPDASSSSGGELQLLSRDEIKARGSDEPTWVIINDEVWDVSVRLRARGAAAPLLPLVCWAAAALSPMRSER
jgi:hypothetical protein